MKSRGYTEKTVMSYESGKERQDWCLYSESSVKDEGAEPLFRKVESTILAGWPSHAH